MYSSEGAYERHLAAMNAEARPNTAAVRAAAAAAVRKDIRGIHLNMPTWGYLAIADALLELQSENTIEGVAV